MKFNKQDNYPIEYIEALYGINLCLNPSQFCEITELLPELKYFKNYLETRRHFVHDLSRYAKVGQYFVAIEKNFLFSNSNIKKINSLSHTVAQL